MILGMLASGCASFLLKSEEIKPDLTKTEVSKPVITDVAAARCPDGDATEFNRTTKRPEPDIQVDGVPALSKGATREWIDKLKKSEDVKNAAGQRLKKDLDTCRGANGNAVASQVK